MYRRFVSLLLLPCVLLTQSVAALGHAHGGNQPAGHDLRPHFHTNSASARPGHESGHHHHGPGGHHHHHDDGDDAPEPGTTQPTPNPEPLSEHEHDSDAVFISAVDAAVVERSQVDEEVASPTWWIAADSILLAAWDGPPTQPVVCGYPPPLTRVLCPLYIRHLALLI